MEHSGQTFVESVLVMPLFLLMVFLLLQVGHLGMAMAIVHYGASSAAHQAVVDNQRSDDGALQNKFRGLLGIGLQYMNLTSKLDDDAVAPNITVTACAELPAYPFVGPFLWKALSKSGGNDCSPGAKDFGPVALQGPSPYKFILESKAMARMNYNPN